jgi:hypothetical protein
VRFPADPATVCGVDVAVLDGDPSGPPLTIDEARVEAIEDPVGHWVRRYAEVAKQVAGGQLGVIAYGTDFNGLNGTTDISEYPVPDGARAASSCPAPGSPTDAGDASPESLAPMRFRNTDGTLGGEVLLEERGLATYGLLADFTAAAAAIPGCGPDVRDSLMLSAEAAIRTWEALVDPGAPPRPPLPTRAFACDPPAGPSP